MVSEALKIVLVFEIGVLESWFISIYKLTIALPTFFETPCTKLLRSLIFSNRNNKCAKQHLEMQRHVIDKHVWHTNGGDFSNLASNISYENLNSMGIFVFKLKNRGNLAFCLSMYKTSTQSMRGDHFQSCAVLCRAVPCRAGPGRDGSRLNMMDICISRSSCNQLEGIGKHAHKHCTHYHHTMTLITYECKVQILSTF